VDISAGVAAQPKLPSRKRWLRLLTIPALVIAAPFLLVAVFMTMRLGTVLVTRPYAWETFGSNFNAAELSGTYVLTEDVDADSKLTRDQMRNVRLLLASDHSARVSLVPDMDTWGELQKCTRNGTGRWDTFSGQLHIDIDHADSASKESCGMSSTSYSFEILRHNRLWLFVGDPDEGRGLIFTRQ
jgi:hypothetical protein